MYDNLYTGLRKRWVISLKPIDDESPSDLFGYKNLCFDTNIASLEPDDVTDYISAKKILVNNTKNWYHPEYLYSTKKDKDLKASIRVQKVVEAAAAACEVPFYSLFRGDISSKIIDRIAKIRARELEDSIDNITELDELKQKYIELFSKQDPNFEDTLETCTDIDDLKDKVRDSLVDLRSSWSGHIKSFFDGIIKNRVYFLRLEKSEIGRAIAIFTAINEGGQKLSTFDLIVAKAAKDPLKQNTSLIQRIRDSVTKKVDLKKSKLDVPGVTEWVFDWMGCIDGENSIAPIFKDNFLNVLSGFAHGNYLNDKEHFTEKLSLDCFKSGMQLKLNSSQIAANYEIAIKAITRAYAFLQFRCGVVSITELNYKLMLLPIAFCLVEDKCWEDKSVLDKLEFWYWSSIFSARYRDRQNEKSLEDCKFLFNTLVLGKELSDKMKKSLISNRDSIFTSTTYCDEDTLTRKDETSKVPTAIHSAILQYILSNTPGDFLPKDHYETYHLCAWEIARCVHSDYEIVISEKKGKKENKTIKLQDHHIFPLGAAKSLNNSTKSLRTQKDHPLNSPLNRTFISSLANGLISSMAPDQYFKDVNEKSLEDHLAADFNSAKKEKNESDKEFYIRLLKQRFASIKKKLSTELDFLWKL